MSKGSFITRTPQTVPGLKLWLDAADASTITIVTGVSSWRDKSGNGFNPVQATTSRQPAYTANSQAGLYGIVFDGTDDNLQTSSNSVLMDPETGYMSIFAVTKLTAAFSGTYGFGKGRLNATTSAAGWANTTNTSQWRLCAGTVTPTNIGDSDPISTPESNASIKEWYFTGTTLDYLLNGSALGSQKSYAASVTSSSALSIGSRPALDLFTAMNAYEIIIYKASVSSDDRTAVRRYLANKWGIAVS